MAGVQPPPPEGPASFAAYPRTALPPRVRFQVIGEAFRLFGAAPGPYLVAALPQLLLTAALVIYYGLQLMEMLRIQPASGPPPLGQFAEAWIAQTGASTGYYFLLYLSLAGVTRMAMKHMQGVPIRAMDAFTLDGNGLHVALVLLIMGFAIGVGSICCVVPGLIAHGLLMLAVPIAIARRTTGVAACTESWNALKPCLWPAVGLMLVANTITQVSMLVCGIGLLVGGPIYAIIQALVYRDFYLTGQAYQREAPYPVDDRTGR